MSDNKKRLTKAKKQSNNNANNNIDNEVELKEDCMDLIRAQNKKIQGLFSEIEKKDKLLAQYQIQLKSFEELTIENNFLKSQISAINEDFHSKMNSMKEFYEKEIEKLLNDIKEKEEINTELLGDLQNIKQLLDENKKKFEMIQKENKINIEKINKSLNSEKDYESKAKELVNIIESQDVELKKFSEVVGNLQSIIDETKKINDDLTKENEELHRQSTEHENVMINMNNTIEDLKSQLKNHSEELKKNGDKTENINKNYQKSLIKISQLENELNIVNNSKDELIKNMEKERNQFLSYSKIIYELLSYFKTVMNSGYTWAATYIRPHLGFESLENIIKDNGFILGPEELVNNIESNFNYLKDDSNLIIKIIAEIYQEFVELVKNLYVENNEEFSKLNKIISIQKSGNSELLNKINSIENNSSKLQEEFKKTMSEHKANESSLNSIKTENNSIKIENNNLKIKLQNYENEINEMYQKLLNIIKININIFQTNATFNNIFRLQNLSQNENDNIKKLNIIKENYLNFGELSINVITELSHQTDMIQDYNRLKEECKKINKELLQFKKEYSILLNNFNQEKENMTNLIHEQKEKEIKMLKKEDYDKIDNLNKIIKQKEEEIEKLSNDNNLLYQQYTLSQNNFEQYKQTRQKDDLNIQEKINEMKKNIDNKNKEIKKYKNEKEIILNKSKIMEESLTKKNKENEILLKQIDSLKKTKNLII